MVGCDGCLKRVHVVAVALATATACATNPVTGKREISLMSEAQEIGLGQQYDAEVRREMGVYDDPKLQQYVEAIGMQLARASERPNLPWHFTIVDVPAVNAFALPGGYVYLARGILPYLDDEAELAGVLGHEIGHVTARHAAQQYTQATSAGIGLTIASIFFPAVRPFGQVAETGLALLFLKHGREDELQADQLGARYATTGGWDPSGVPDLLNTLSRIQEATDRKGVPNWLSTHPNPEDRVVRVEATVQQLETGAGRELKVDRDGYLSRIEGLIYGDNPEEGIVRANAFLHPSLRFALEFPRAWEIVNSKTQVVAKQPDAERYMLLQLVQEPQGRTVEEIAVRGMQRAGFRLVQGQPQNINGLDAHVGVYQGSMEGLGSVVVRAAHITHDRNAYVLAGIAPRNDFQAADREFAASIGSFRALSRSEAANIRPNRVDLYVVRNGDTWESIAERISGGTVKASTLAIMNDSPATQPPQTGRQIKVVVGG